MSERKLNIWKILSALIISILLFVSFILLLQYVEIIDINSNDWFVLSIAVMSMLLSLLAGIIASDGFEYHMYGLELCGVTVGGAISITALQIINEHNLLPNVDRILLSKAGFLDQASVQTQNIFFLFMVLLISLTSLFLIALICKAIKNEEPPLPGTLAFIAFILGSGMYSFTVLTLVGQ